MSMIIEHFTKRLVRRIKRQVNHVNVLDRIAGNVEALVQLSNGHVKQANILDNQVNVLDRVAGNVEALVQLSKRSRGDCFSSSFIHVNDALANIDQLARGYRDEATIKDFVRIVAGSTMVPYDGLATLVDQVRYCDEQNIEGDFVELGLWKGGCLGIMALTNLAFGTKRRVLHGFDSFEGIPMPRRDKDDMDWAITEMRLSEDDCDGRLTPAKQLIGPKRDVEMLIKRIGYPRDLIELHEGWFQETVPAAKIDKIAILRLDGDLYDSYAVPLEHFYDRVVPGGFIIIDDWILEGCRQAVNEFFARRKIRPYLSHVDQSVRYFQKTS